MTTRSDVIVDFAPATRIAVVEAPSTEFVIQDIVDTLRKREDTFTGQSEFKLLNASGKEDLGGGVAVGITAELQNTQIAFEGRTTPAYTGFVTAPSDPPVGNSPSRASGLIVLYDDNADFVNDNIVRGSLVINYTDQSIAEVYSSDNATSLTTRTLVNGITNTFQTNDVYQVYNVIQCEVIGGNIVGVNGVGDAQSPISPTAFTQVIRTGSSSATLVDGGGSGTCPTATENAEAIWDYDPSLTASGTMGGIQRAQAFHNHIHVDTNNGQPGTGYPLGTHEFPTDNFADAVTIGHAEGISNINVAEDATILSTDDVSGFTIFGAHAAKSEITVQAGAKTEFTQFETCSLKGELDGYVIVRESIIDEVTNFEGIMFQTAIGGSITLANTNKNNVTTYILDCYSGVPGKGTPTIDFDDSPHALAIRAYNGGIKLINKSEPESVSIDVNSGQVILDGTVTAGEIVVRGIYHLEDNSGGTTTVIRNTNLDTIEIKVDNVQITVDTILVTVQNMSLVIDDLIKYQRNKTVIDPAAFTLTIYEDDGTTPLTTFDLQDQNGVSSVLSIFKRIPQ